MSVPTIHELSGLIERARVAGRCAAQDMHDCLSASAGPGVEMLDICGDGIVILEIDGRSRLGRFLISVGDGVPGANVSRSWRGREISVSIHDMTYRQEMSINVAAARAALGVLEAGLGVKGHVKEWID